VPSRAPQSRRQRTLLAAGIGVVAGLIAAALLPVPYVILSPGPTINTLGSLHGRAVIQVSGRPTYPATGHLNMVTVSFLGGPAGHFSAFTAVLAWLNPHDAVVPEEDLFGPGQTEQQVVRQDIQQMAGSQQAATAAALCLLRIPFTVVDTVTGTVRGLPAAGVLRKGDVITAVDGTPVTCRSGVGHLIRARPPGTAVTLTIRRGGEVKQVRVGTAAVHGHAVAGVEIRETYRFPVSVKIRVGSIGGPSAGMMFALGIIDKLTPGSLTGGRFVAGTGEIAPDGAIGAIGGIQQKMDGARAAGATVFLVPSANCPDARGAVPAGMRLVRVSTLAGAVAALHAVAAGRPVPTC
jgi:PDZ domain-containing protein